MSNVSCPVCASVFPLEAGVNEADALRFAALIAETPKPVQKYLKDYIVLFKPLKRGLTWSRRLDLLQEIVMLTTAGVIEHRKRRYGCSPELWAQGMREMLAHIDRLELPMKGHGYLVSIVAARAAATERSSAADEHATEEARRRPYREGEQRGPQPIGNVLSRVRSHDYVPAPPEERSEEP